RLYPADKLPVGTRAVLPASFILRLRHLETKPVSTNLSLVNYTGAEFSGKKLMAYSLEFPELQRTLTYIFEKGGTREIVGWTDTYPSAFDKKARTTIARKKTQNWLDYWRHNAATDQSLRKELGIIEGY